MQTGNKPILAAVVPQTNTRTDEHILRNCSSANYTIESCNSVRYTAASRTAAYISLQLHGMTHEDIQAETTEAEFCEIQDSGSRLLSNKYMPTIQIEINRPTVSN